MHDRYKGHLENLSKNTLIGATNAENNKINCVRNILTGRMSFARSHTK